MSEKSLLQNSTTNAALQTQQLQPMIRYPQKQRR
jgi:hypothetical protein